MDEDQRRLEEKKDLKKEKKPLSGPREKTVKRLFAVSQNKCAFSNCPEPLVTDSGKVTGKICHIKARSARGPRFDPEQSAEERHGFDNLILLCPKHHDIIDDDEKSYTVERILEIKKEHEEKSTKDMEANSHIITSLLQNIYVHNEVKVNYEFTNNGQIASSIINYVVLDSPDKRVRVNCNRVRINIEQIREELAQRKERYNFVPFPVRSIDYEKYFDELFDYLDVKDSTALIHFFEKIQDLNEYIENFKIYGEKNGFINGRGHGPILHAEFSKRVRVYNAYVEAAYNEDVSSLLKRLEVLGR